MTIGKGVIPFSHFHAKNMLKFKKKFMLRPMVVSVSEKRCKKQTKMLNFLARDKSYLTLVRFHLK